MQQIKGLVTRLKGIPNLKETLFYTLVIWPIAFISFQKCMGLNIVNANCLSITGSLATSVIFFFYVIFSQRNCLKETYTSHTLSSVLFCAVILCGLKADFITVFAVALFTRVISYLLFEWMRILFES